MYEDSYMKYMNTVSAIYKFQNIATWIHYVIDIHCTVFKDHFMHTVLLKTIGRFS